MRVMKVQPLEFEKPIIELEQKLEEFKRQSQAQDIDLDSEVKKMEAKIEETKLQTYQKLTAWQRVQIARHPARPPRTPARQPYAACGTLSGDARATGRSRAR